MAFIGMKYSFEMLLEINQNIIINKLHKIKIKQNKHETKLTTINSQ